MMNAPDMTWAVTIVYPVHGPIEIEPILAAYAGSDIAFSQSDDELSFTATVDAATARDAEMIAESVFFRATDDMDLPVGSPVETRVLEWSRFEAELDLPNFPDIVSAPEVGEILGVSRQRVHQLIKENRSFPPPILRLGSGPIWLRATIEAFNRSWTRKPGRPSADMVLAMNSIRAQVETGSGAAGDIGAGTGTSIPEVESRR